MADLIDRDALIAEYDRVHVGTPGGARKLMVDAPRIDAKIVRHGRWIMTASEYYHMMMHERCIPYTAVEYFVEPDDTACSVCAEKYNTNDFGCLFDVFPEYCPNCGAKMNEGEKE